MIADVFPVKAKCGACDRVIVVSSAVSKVSSLGDLFPILRGDQLMGVDVVLLLEKRNLPCSNGFVLGIVLCRRCPQSCFRSVVLGVIVLILRMFVVTKA